jgi:tRNA(Ser,Leu) C12 N-acetylase TAN1
MVNGKDFLMKEHKPDRAPKKKTFCQKRKNQDFISLNVKVDSGETIRHDVGIDV